MSQHPATLPPSQPGSYPALVQALAALALAVAARKRGAVMEDWCEPRVRVRCIIAIGNIPGGLHVLRAIARCLLLLAELLHRPVRVLGRAASVLCDPYDKRYEHPSEDRERRVLLDRAWRAVHR
jgi:hypothetical protein